jgi:thiol-disulfide isomerase/thioredoxin
MLMGKRCSSVLLTGALLAGVLSGGNAMAAASWKAFSAPGGQAPAPLALQDLNGKPVDLAALKGEVVLVNFWATWCEPCRDEMPALDRLSRTLAGRHFRVVGVNVGEGEPRIRQFLERVPVGFPILRDSAMETMKAWRVRVLPASFLVDKNGMLRYQLVGETDWENAAQQAPIMELLK